MELPQTPQTQHKRHAIQDDAEREPDTTLSWGSSDMQLVTCFGSHWC